jgi:hypothetical protein
MWLKQAKEGSLFRQPELRQSSAIRALLIAPALIGSAKSGHSVPLSKLLKGRASRNASFRPVYTHLHSECWISVANSIGWSQLHSLGRQTREFRQSWAGEAAWKGMELFGIFSGSAQPVHLQHPGYYF